MKNAGIISLVSVFMLVLLVLPASAGIRTDFNTELIYRYMKGHDAPATFDLPGVELSPQITLTGESGDIMTLAFQIFAGGTMHDAMKDMHYGNAYLLIPTGLGKPTFKIGQQIIPFGNLAEYDTHSQIMQTLYAKSLGLRIDSGLSVYGMAGKYDYWAMVGNGNGPGFMDNDHNKVISGRIARTYSINTTDLRLGLSALHGNLPHYMPGEDVYQDMMGMPMKELTEAKSRYALDLEVSNGPLLVRGEIVGGKNDLRNGSNPVLKGDAIGYYAEVRYALNDRWEVMGKYDYWRPYAPIDEITTSTGLGLQYAINKNLQLQLAVERFENKNISGVPEHRDMATLQIGASF